MLIYTIVSASRRQRATPVVASVDSVISYCKMHVFLIREESGYNEELVNGGRRVERKKKRDVRDWKRMKEECDNFAWDKWNVFDTLPAILTWNFDRFAVLSLNELRRYNWKQATISFTQFPSVPIICDCMSISSEISAWRFRILNEVFHGFSGHPERCRCRNTNDAGRLFSISLQIPSSLMIPQLDLLLTEPLTSQTR